MHTIPPATARGATRQLFTGSSRKKRALMAALAVLVGAGVAGLPAPLGAQSAAHAENSGGQNTTPGPVGPTGPGAVKITSPVEEGSFHTGSSLTITGTVTFSSSDPNAGQPKIEVSAGRKSCTTLVPTQPGDPTTVPPDTAWSCTLHGLTSSKSLKIIATPVWGPVPGQKDERVVKILLPPTFDNPANGGNTTRLVEGTAFPDALVRVIGAFGVITKKADPNGYWSIFIEAPGTYIIRATQEWSDTEVSEKSADHTVTVIENTPPPTPAITSPGQGKTVDSSRLTVSGTGSNGHTVFVYVKNVRACSAVVTGVVWACEITTLSPGVNEIKAMQFLVEGFPSSPSAPITVTYQVAAAPLTPGSPRPGTSAKPTPAPAPIATDDANAAPSPDAEVPWTDYKLFPGADGSGPTLYEALTNWGTATNFGKGLPTPSETLARGTWVWAPLIGLAFIILVALPLRMLVTLARARLRKPFGPLTGRNRPLPVNEEKPPRNPWIVGAVPLAAAAAFIVMGDGLSAEVRYLRLFAAVGIGLAILNVVGVALSTRAASAWQNISGRLRFRPLLLLAAAIFALLSRISGIEPPVVTGVIIGIGFGMQVAARPRALVSLAQVGATLALAIAAWLGYASIGTPYGFWQTFLVEILATICLAGIGSTLVLMLPLGPLPGRVIMECSRAGWTVSAFVVSSIAGGMVLAGVTEAWPIIASALMALSFAALCLAAWSWMRYVKPVAV